MSSEPSGAQPSSVPQSSVAETDYVAQTGGTGKPAVSVVIPVFISTYVADAVRSVLQQTFTDYEIIVVNDGSPQTEDLERRLEPYRSKILYLKQPDEGPSSARNNAIRHAKGEYLAFLDHDDVWLPDYLAKQMEAFREDPPFDAIYADAVIFGPTHFAGRTYMQTHPSKGPATLEAVILGRCNVITTGLVARRSHIVEAGLFDEKIHVCEDLDLWLRMLNRGSRFGYHNQVLARRRVHDRSATLDGTKTARSTIDVLRGFSKTPGLAPAILEAIDSRAAELQFELDVAEGKWHLQHGRYAEARVSLRKASAVRGGWKLNLILAAMNVAPSMLQAVYTRQVENNQKKLASSAE